MARLSKANQKLRDEFLEAQRQEINAACSPEAMFGKDHISQEAARELLEAAKKVLEHVEDDTAERINNQCTLCYSYRKILRDAIAKAEGR